MGHVRSQLLSSGSEAVSVLHAEGIQVVLASIRGRCVCARARIKLTMTTKSTTHDESHTDVAMMGLEGRYGRRL